MRTASPVGRVLLAGALWWVAALVGFAVGLPVAAAVPCQNQGFSCLSVAIGGGLIGAVVAVLAVSWAGRRLGLRWWWVPVSLILCTGALPLEDTPGVWLVLGLAPFVAALTALPGARAWRPVVVLGAAALLVAGGWLWRQVAVDGAAVAEVEQSGVALLAPLERPDLRIATVHVLAVDPPVVSYSVAPADDPRDWISVDLRGRPRDWCADGRCTDLADGVTRDDGPDGQAVRYIVERDGVVAVFGTSHDGTWGGWSEAEILRLAADLEPTTAAWLIEHEG